MKITPFQIQMLHYVDAASILPEIIATMVLWEGLICELNPFSSMFVSYTAALPKQYYPNLMKGHRRN